MGLFSGDGAGILAGLLRKYGAEITGGLHLKMPDSINDEKVLKRDDKKNLAPYSRTVWAKAVFLQQDKTLHRYLKNRSGKIYRGGLFEKICPMRNIKSGNGTAVSGNQCTMCYRCVNKCPRQAITLLGKHVVEPYNINRHL